MKKRMGNNKGSTLVLVIVILALVAILADMLIETSFQNYKISKASGYMDYSYYAGESAVQKCCDILKRKCDGPDLAAENHIAYTGDNEAFSQKIVKKVLSPYIADLNSKDCFKDIDISGEASNTADVKIGLQYLDCRYNLNEPDRIYIKVGMTADTSYAVRPYTSGDKKVFAAKEFAVYLPEGFKLKGPVYGIGDLMADGNSTVNITGDVHVYGTSPEYLAQTQQYFYGGILAKDNSEMWINGNAYSRSFIRTGLYSSTEDISRIYIFKDAIAQGIQIFGKNERIGVMRNAYTFDDIEVNGENSVIAVNGSYFGLSNGENTEYHDGSSAIVNSATIHHANSEESQKSRIVVNGAVMVNGGTFRIDLDSEDTLYQIEDASVAWITDPNNYGPVYKKCPPVSGTDYKAWLIGQGYHESANGFCNLFQVWDPMSWEDSAGNIKSKITGWFSKIDAARQAGSSNDTAYFDNKDPSGIQGFCNFILAANDKMYLMEKSDEDKSGLKRAAILEDDYILDSVEPPSGFSDWSTFWNNYIDEGYAWNGGYCTNIPTVLQNTLSPALLDLTNLFIKRYTYDSGKISGSDVIEHRSEETFEAIQDSLDDLIAAAGSNPYIIIATNGDLGSTDYAYNNTTDPTYSWAVGKYFLVVNKNPNRDLVLNGTTFNGIIFTPGRVVLKNGAKVNGAIVAAGRGYDPDSSTGYVEGSAAETKEKNGINIAYRAPRIKQDGSNLDVLEDGGYAAVYCKGGNISINFPDPDPDKGREELLDIFETQDPAYPIDLSSIF